MLSIGSYTPEGLFFLAPMEGVTRTPFRILCRRRGAALVTTDMIDADTFCGIADVRGVEQAIREQIDPRDEDALVIQLGGSDPTTLVRAAQILEEYAVIIDLNAGCPTGKTFEKGGGCTLMKEPERLYRIVRALRRTLRKPFTVKLRKGWDSPQAVGIARELESLGVDGITIHPRTREQRYSDRADWAYAADVKRAVRIPVTLSGDITDVRSAREASRISGCDYFMIGRAARANPSIFEDLQSGIDTGKTADRSERDFAEWYALCGHAPKRAELKERAIWTVSGAANAKELKRAISTCDDPEAIRALVHEARFPKRLKAHDPNHA